MMRRSHFKLVILVASLCGCAATAPLANAAYIETFTQVGSDVDAIGTGTLNLTALNSVGADAVQAELFPGACDAVLGAPGTDSVNAYYGVTGPAKFGGTLDTSPSSGTGGEVGILFNVIGVPPGYVSGASLSETDIFSNKTFATLQLTPGTYTWTWGSGGTADSLTVIAVASPVPEPVLVSVLGFSSLALLHRRARRVVKI